MRVWQARYYFALFVCCLFVFQHCALVFCCCFDLRTFPRRVESGGEWGDIVLVCNKGGSRKELRKEGLDQLWVGRSTLKCGWNSGIWKGIRYRTV
ncbi:hypothetical protein BZA05DRAFT_408066 [Tricharina praecox]|uniref:uncharacterized protein n=1 Tax=Tricharina praecox TaxID=43433 RepID=UPI002220D175|nr:uncharacterized protein BZA05DRAFT_408066 [Tricharina praecox]KAI5845559.1 hypothetical protein BZA05DRAFT_408066 [Tricharina praecox]